MTIDILPQAYAVEKLIASIQAIMPQIPESQDKEALIESIKVFQNTVVLTTWDTEDVQNHIRDIKDTLVQPYIARDVLIQMLNDYECYDQDWLRIEQAYDSINRTVSVKYLHTIV